MRVRVPRQDHGHDGAVLELEARDAPALELEPHHVAVPRPAGYVFRKRLFAAGVDVYEREPEIHPRLLSAPRTVLLPHIGSATIATRRAMCELAISGALTVLAGDRPANLVSPG